MTDTPKQPETVSVVVDRRRFLTWVVASPALVVAARLGLDVPSAEAAEPIEETALNLYIAIQADGRVVTTLPRTEMGQGITTGVAMLTAEELDTRLESVDVRTADADPRWVIQLTGASSTMRYLAGPIRAAAATARARLVTAAANRWRVPAHTLTTVRGEVIAPDGRRAGYGELAGDAARVLLLLVPATPKPTSEYTVVGQPTGRIDARDIVTGAAKYTLDLDIPDAVPLVVARPPTIRGSVRDFDASTALSMPGVLGVARLPTGVAVAARTYAQAFAARDALRISWAPGPASQLSDTHIRSRLRDAIGARPLPPLFTARTLEGRFDFPYLAHAPMETQGCVARVTGDRAEIWMGAQDPKFVQREVAEALGWVLAPQRVTVHASRAGGGFGRRFFAEAAVEAALAARALGRPVKLMWTRNDDMRHGRYRPASHHRILAYVGANGSILGWNHQAAIPTVELPHGFGDLLTALVGQALPEVTSALFFTLSQHVPYHFGLVSQELREVSIPIPTASFRSVFTSQVGVANEVFIDQLARGLGRDPVELRRSQLKSARLKAVLDKVAQEGQWGRALPPGVAQGVAVLEEWDSAVAHLVEVDVTGEAPRVLRVVIAADVGLPINPKSIEAQLQGAAIDAFSTTLSAGIHIDAGAVREGSFADYRWFRMKHAPAEISVHLVRSDDRVGGVGELGYPSAAAALTNAIARATGTMPTRFPLLDSGA
ncbi:xanthine dehydrogenase family protein molybdopterin-binding subunit [Pyxidicoccus fallax]|uniref:Xanthine dehydrogenase family protein molybdopterin-binding subunit n=1 Tax=Pyxidicoccus fallax TaxID=394095 RepID=A0A848LY45_9BACT|nr:molybdopterin cofactor-binding domain-containing protein [Pyxidicoccus fallax]NMO22746.1 xanthine dehydrogenase family protein molybdopterin-binding subunit [Pyxidicoccus fallax]NPC84879.1 xanthine dehydrogenase family protein molybdopterin-binding subunit [Pyxidicoccus fallax]